MEAILKIAGIGILGAVFGTLIKKNGGELSLLLSLSVCVAIILMTSSIIKPILEFVEQLRAVSGISSAVLAPLFKAVGIGLLTKISSTLCADAKEGAISSFIETAGAVMAIYVSLPLMSAVLEMLSSMI